jgi:mannose-6-phosphate isomerase class I
MTTNYARTGSPRVWSSGREFQLELLDESRPAIRLILSGGYTQKAVEVDLSVFCTAGDCAVERGGRAAYVTDGDRVIIPAGSGEVNFSGIGSFLITKVN